MTHASRKTSPPVLLLVLAFATVYVVWGSTYLAIRFAVEAFPPFMMAGVRFLSAGAILYPVVRLRGAPRPTRRHWRNAAIAGALMLAGGNGLVCWSEQHVNSGTAALLVATVPIWFAVLDWVVFNGQRPTVRVVGGIVLGIAGVFALVGSGSGNTGAHYASGCAALVIACALWSTGSLFARRATMPSSAFLTTAMEMIAAGVVLLLIGAAVGEGPRGDPAAISPKAWASFAYLIVFGSILALSAYTWLLTVATPARVATYAYVNPVIAVLLGAMVGGEPLGPRVLIAGVAIVAAVCLIALGTRRPDSPPQRSTVPDDTPASAESDARDTRLASA